MFALADDRNSYRVRVVEVPDDEAKGADEHDLLELVFKYGQNDFQPQNIYSVSVGDIAVINGKYWMVMGTGWKELTKKEFDVLTPPTSDIGYGFKK